MISHSPDGTSELSWSNTPPLAGFPKDCYNGGRQFEVALREGVPCENLAFLLPLPFV